MRNEWTTTTSQFSVSASLRVQVYLKLNNGLPLNITSEIKTLFAKIEVWWISTFVEKQHVILTNYKDGIKI